MASFPQENHYRQFLQQPPLSQPRQSSLRDLYDNNMDGQISQPVPYLNTPNLLDQHRVQVAGLAPGAVNEESNRLDVQWNSELDSKEKRPIEQPFLENKFGIDNSNTNSQRTSLDLLQARSVVSTGLGLSLENPPFSYSGNSSLLGVIGDALDLELQRQDAEIDRFLKVQGDQLREAILKKLQETQLHTFSYVEGKVLQKLQEKEAEVDDINKKNKQLEVQVERLIVEAANWESRAKHGENMANALRHNLQQVYAQSRDGKEGCGDSEVDDTASCFNGRPAAVLPRKDTKEAMSCKVCRSSKVCMLLLPCKHLCLCKVCESRLSLCPVCGLSKYIGMEVFM
ncbi:BOI-related E3 ubiquitin-protein ligase 1-like isoform X2 [Andrographis paniculata]|uniref:BOI-related E3 ubiquitin-protein ligase 1-like isoform X2 n=1 Tax=Andrographis paniculata TaxID=175694 RepID=UPI0021E96020|nr:BOI-related E3 ubiquitin-protein ligase 1-like isoform X2 [Andrographis paniculata]